MRHFMATMVIITFGVLVGCGESRFDRTTTGAGIGAGTGAVAGLALGPIGVATGALIGAGAGGGVGFATDSNQVNLGKPIYC
jgi:osmotically inducible lipoprotein OsmB